MQWKPIDTCPFGEAIVVKREGWDGLVTVDWKNEAAKRADLSNWIDPPTHWLDGIPPLIDETPHRLTPS